MLKSFEKAIVARLDLARWYRADDRERMEIMRGLFGYAKSVFGFKPELYFTMPAGFEMAKGLSDPITGDIHLNQAQWKDCDPIEPLFYFLHELEHSIQSSHKELFSEAHRINTQYQIQFDGTGYKTVDGEIRAVKLEGKQGYFTELYLASPCERDANSFAYRCLKAAGAEGMIDDLYAMWSPRYTYFSEEEAQELFLKAVAEIDRLVNL